MSKLLLLRDFCTPCSVSMVFPTCVISSGGLGPSMYVNYTVRKKMQMMVRVQELAHQLFVQKHWLSRQLCLLVEVEIESVGWPPGRQGPIGQNRYDWFVQYYYIIITYFYLIITIIITYHSVIITSIITVLLFIITYYYGNNGFIISYYYICYYTVVFYYYIYYYIIITYYYKVIITYYYCNTRNGSIITHY